VTQAQSLAKALNAHTKSGNFTYAKARATARQDANVDWNATKARNDGFNPDVDGCEDFVMRDGSACVWSSPSNSYVAKAS
jgi:hypothetical protein